MPRVSSRRKQRVVEESDDEPEDKFVVKDEAPAPKRARGSGAAAAYDDYDQEGEDMEGLLTLTQQCSPEKSQAMPNAKAYERANLDNMTEDGRNKVIVDMSRLVLFKALSGEPIDRLKCSKLAGLPSSSRVTSAVWEEVQTNLQNVFGFELQKPPKSMKLAKKYDDRYYCINCIQEDQTGAHSKAIHSEDTTASIERGLLMTILAFCFCKGSPRPGSGSTTMRWITDSDLYRLLHGLDENLPSEPPSVTQRKKDKAGAAGITVVDGTSPKLDVLMDKFVAKDYLIKDKMADSKNEDDVIIYTMGPRAVLEIGRRQIIFFCAEVLEEQPDPTMLQELDEEGAEEVTQTQ